MVRIAICCSRVGNAIALHLLENYEVDAKFDNV